MKNCSRRNFIKLSSGAACSLLVPKVMGCTDDTGSSNDTNRTGSTVHALAGDDYAELYRLGKEAAQKLGLTKNSLTGTTVFIKTNLLHMGEIKDLYNNMPPFHPSQGECTKPELVVGIAEQCLEAGAAKVTIGDGAQGISWDWQEVVFFDGNNIHGATNLKSAVDYLATTYGDSRVELLCLNQVDEWEFIPSCSNAEVMKNGLMIARSFHNADHAISAACPKTHIYTQMTAAMKNYVGLIPSVHLGLGIVRSEAHKAYSPVSCFGIDRVGIAGAFTDIVQFRQDEGKDDFAILDCSVGLEGDGPHIPPVNNGIPIAHRDRNALGKFSVLSSQDFVAADSIAAQIMNLPVAEVKQLTLASNRGLGEVADVTLSGIDLSDLIIPDWKQAIPTDESFFDDIPAPLDSSDT